MAAKTSTIRFERVRRSRVRGFVWLAGWMIVGFFAFLAANLDDGELKITLGNATCDPRMGIVLVLITGYVAAFMRFRTRIDRGYADLKQGRLVALKTGAPLVRAEEISGASFASDPNDPEQILVAAVTRDGRRDLILQLPRSALQSVREALDVPSGGAGVLPFRNGSTASNWAPKTWFAIAGIWAVLWSANVATDGEVTLPLFLASSALGLGGMALFLAQSSDTRPYLELSPFGIRALFARRIADSRPLQRIDRTIPWSAIVSVAATRRQIHLREAGFAGLVDLSIPLMLGLTPLTQAAIVAQITDAARRARGTFVEPSGDSALFEGLLLEASEPTEAWRARLDIAISGAGYRGSRVDADVCETTFSNPDIDPKVRVAAGYLLAQLAPERSDDVYAVLDDLRDEEARTLAKSVRRK